MARSKKHAAAATARGGAPPRRRQQWIPALIVVAGLLVYLNCFDNPFLFDDISSVTQNPTIKDLSSVRVLQPPADHPMAGRPLVNLSFAVNYALDGTHAWGCHAVNLGLHLLCGLLVFAVVGRQLPASMAGAVALLWTVHPLNSEVVNYVTQRTESMMALCLLLTLYLASVHGPARGRAQVASVIVCAAGMACKETMAVAPLAVWLYDSVYEYGSPWAALRARARLYAALALTWLVVGLLTATSGQSLTAGYTFAQPDPWLYLLNQGEIILRYLRLAVWPDALVLYYGWPRAVTLADVWPSFLLVGVLVAGTAAALVRWPRVGALGAWVFLTLGPTSSLIPIVTEVGAERRMYLPLVGVITLAVAGAAWLWAKATAQRPGMRHAPVAAVALIAVAFGVTTHARTREYESTVRMAETIHRRWPTPYSAHLVGAALVHAGCPADAVTLLEASAAGYPMAQYTLAEALVRTGRAAEAIPVLHAFLCVAPPPAVRNAEMLLAQAYLAAGQPGASIDQLAKVLADAPAFTPAHALIADLLADAQRFAEAIPHYQAVLTSAPPNARAATGLGVALVAAGRGAEAVAAFRLAAEAEPRNAQYRQNLARALGDHGDPAEALTQAQEAVSLDAKDAGSFGVLGVALLRLGRVADARLSFQRALQIDPTHAPAIHGLRALNR